MKTKILLAVFFLLSLLPLVSCSAALKESLDETIFVIDEISLDKGNFSGGKFSSKSQNDPDLPRPTQDSAFVEYFYSDHIWISIVEPDGFVSEMGIWKVEHGELMCYGSRSNDWRKPSKEFRMVRCRRRGKEGSKLLVAGSTEIAKLTARDLIVNSYGFVRSSKEIDLERSTFLEALIPSKP